MADPTNPTTTPAIVAPTTADNDAWSRYTDLTTAAGTKLNDFTSSGSLAKLGMDALSGAFAAAGSKLQGLTDLASTHSETFGMMATSILGVKKSFDNLAGVDGSRLITFSGQFEHLMEIIKQGPGTSLAKDSIDKILETMKKGGAAPELLAKAMSELKSGVVSTASAFLQSADNIVRLQDSIFQLSMQAGGAPALFDKIGMTIQSAGDHFEQMNQVSDKYVQRMIESKNVTHLSDETLASYASTINKMPGGLRALVDSQGVTTKSSNILTDSILYAVGAGRDQAEVFEDMNKAMSQYGASGDDALKFSARMTEVADTLGAQMKDVRGAVNASADAFKGFVGVGMGPGGVAAMTQGMSKAMEEYVARLKEVGVPVQNAIDMFQQYTSNLHSMTIGQKAFLSAQSGGPGGLRGGFQIDAMIKKGDFEGVRRKMEETLKKMTGPIVSLDEASKSESAAARYQKQLMILQQGPLGAQAKTPEEAENLLESLRKGEKPRGAPGEDQKTAAASLEKTVQRGADWQERTHTEVQGTNDRLDGLLLLASGNNLRTAQGALTGGQQLAGGFNQKGSGVQPGQAEFLRQQSATGAGTGTLEGVFKGLGDAVKNMPMAAKSAMTALQEALAGGNLKKIHESQEAMKKQLEAWKSSMASMQGMTEAQKHLQENAATKLGQAVDSSVKQAATKPLFHPTTFTPTGDTSTAGQQVGAAIPSAKQAAAATPAPVALSGQHAPTGSALPSGAPGQPVPVQLVGSGITVKITGTCPHCNRDMTTSGHTSSVTQAGQQ